MERPEDQDIIIIGATGDLARRKLLPALYDLESEGMLPEQGRVVGVARRPLSEDDFKALVRESARERSRSAFEEAVWRRLEGRLSYQALSDGFAGLARQALPRRLIYLATPPESFADLATAIGEAGLNRGARVVIEKPFGYDYESGCRLNRELHAVFSEAQVFRIDHFLGKETVQNVLVFRFANAAFERLWNRDAVEHIEITVAESIGIEGRAEFYEQTGAIRDVLQNHLLQLLAIVAMEPPTSFQGEAVREEKRKLLRAVTPLDPSQVVRGQYAAGRIDGESVPGYRQEEGVAQDSDTETFVAARLLIDNWRWAGVPVFVRTGKRLPAQRTLIEVAFRDVPKSYFEGAGLADLTANHLAISIQPEQEITLSFLMKEPGKEIDVRPAEMHFSYEAAGLPDPAAAYERLIYDALRGDQTHFVRQDSIERSWEIVQPVLERPPRLCFYAAGTWGPREAAHLIAPHLWSLR